VRGKGRGKERGRGHSRQLYHWKFQYRPDVTSSWDAFSAATRVAQVQQVLKSDLTVLTERREEETASTTYRVCGTVLIDKIKRTPA